MFGTVIVPLVVLMNVPLSLACRVYAVVFVDDAGTLRIKPSESSRVVTVRLVPVIVVMLAEVEPRVVMLAEVDPRVVTVPLVVLSVVIFAELLEKVVLERVVMLADVLVKVEIVPLV